jgi:serine/threonine-protein kinase
MLTTFIFIVGISAFFVLTLMIKSEDTVIIPKVTGKDVIYALEILSDLGLNTKVKGSEYNDNIPKNHIIFQDPEPGSEIKKGRDVKIILSKGAKEALTPNLKGLTIDQARIILEENELCPGNTALLIAISGLKMLLFPKVHPQIKLFCTIHVWIYWSVWGKKIIIL